MPTSISERLLGGHTRLRAFRRNSTEGNPRRIKDIVRSGRSCCHQFLTCVNRRHRLRVSIGVGPARKQRCETSAGCGGRRCPLFLVKRRGFCRLSKLLRGHQKLQST
ncbi:hypothetical protein OPV22_006656 [Ensete ventricosum]|uniref:Uncharacterized protein n=1 Tax=Ensete ventricosum TaxID=4639 RepID=A0AAV8RTM3_ENSVE|nr:hypothetical protein OPV22_006656 [Ensete ventricosum]